MRCLGLVAFLLLLAVAGSQARGGEWQIRYLRIEQKGTLNFAEVEVFSEGENVAEGKPARQSSVAFGGIPARAVDGKTLGAWSAGSVIHTGDDAANGEWWEVDLGKAVQVEGFIIWNRTDPGCIGRMVGATVSLLDENRQPVFTWQLDEPEKRYLFGKTPKLDPQTYPAQALKNGEVELTVYLPDAKTGYYRNTRFDWSSMVASLKYKDVVWFGNWKDDVHTSTEVADDASGPAAEFGSVYTGAPPPPGYEEAAPGESFMKIGVGELRKPLKPEYHQYNPENKFRYSSNFPYKTERFFAWEISSGADWIEYAQTSPELKGYRYRLVRKISVTAKPAGFVMTCSLENMGEKPITQAYYEHNFLILAGRRVDESWRVEYPFALEISPAKDSLWKPEGRQLLALRKLLLDDSFALELTGFGAKAADNRVRVWCGAEAGIEISGDQPLAGSILFGGRTVVCPESYIIISAQPGEIFRWRTEYRLLP
jgi:hypothetical protein